MIHEIIEGEGGFTKNQFFSFNENFKNCRFSAAVDQKIRKKKILNGSTIFFWSTTLHL